jgi:hypothetical protein
LGVWNSSQLKVSPLQGLKELCLFFESMDGVHRCDVAPFQGWLDADKVLAILV